MNEISALKMKCDALLVEPQSKAINNLEDAFFDLIDVCGTGFAVCYVLDMLEAQLVELTKNEKN